MGTTTLNIRMDEEVKKQFDSFCDEVGLDASVAINLFAKTVVREQRIPFEIALNEDPFYSEENQQRLKLAAERIEKSGGTIHELVEDIDD